MSGPEKEKPNVAKHGVSFSEAAFPEQHRRPPRFSMLFSFMTQTSFE
ncbi:MAG: hypothetical protein ACREX9_13075 [Gammaproteobacteria bacterium]